MKKISVALEDTTFMQLFDYAAARSRRMRSRFSVSESASELIVRALAQPSPREEIIDGN